MVFRLHILYHSWKNNNIKILLLLCFNLKDNKTVIIDIILTKNENQEIFCSIFKYLNNKYNSQPNTLNIDCNSTEVLVVK